MKVVLTGSTGFIGSEILEQCIAHNYISHVYVLTRKSLDAKYFKREKVTEIIHDDFSEYPDSLLNRLRDEGVEGCIWALGSANIKSYKTLEEAQKVGISYPIQAAEAFAKKLAPGLKSRPLSTGSKPPRYAPRFPFRFIFVSAWGAEQNQFRSLWMWNDSRKIKGAAEKGLFDVASNSEEIDGVRCLEVTALRPGGVIGKSDTIGTILWEATVPSIVVDRLAKCAITTALEGTGDPKIRILENKECLGADWAMVNSLAL